ncbi:MAG TPA: hypothetical protein VMS32_10885 [Verrucomicrobiae bacterium]|jgi:hypothetical protein|nr:hypothetical protein [Verrucomicrobiae bacterium]
MADQAVTYTSSLTTLGAHPFVCKRCHREYPFPKPGERPIRCECGWWYYNDGIKVRDAYWQRLESYRMPPELARLFKTP